MFLNRLNEEQKEQFLDLCNLLVGITTDNDSRDKMAEKIKSYCREMEMPYQTSEEGLLKQTILELTKAGNPKVVFTVALALIPMLRLSGDEDWEQFLTYADIEKDMAEILNVFYKRFEEAFDGIVMELLNSLDRKQKEQFLNLCNLFVSKTMNNDSRDKMIEIMKSYSAKMEMPYPETEKTKEALSFKRKAFQLAETWESSDVGIIAFALIPLLRFSGEEKFLEQFLAYADIEEGKVGALNDLYDRFEPLPAEIGFEVLTALNKEQKELFLKLCLDIIRYSWATKEITYERIEIIKAYYRELELPYPKEFELSYLREGDIKQGIFELQGTGADMESIFAAAFLPLYMISDNHISLYYDRCHEFSRREGECLENCLRYAGMDKDAFIKEYLKDEDAFFIKHMKDETYTDTNLYYRLKDIIYELKSAIDLLETNYMQSIFESVAQAQNFFRS